MVPTVACNAPWTKARAAKAGHVLDDVKCERCGVGEDTLFHRLWICSNPRVKQAHENAALAAVIQAAVKAGHRSALHCRSIFEHHQEDLAEPEPNPRRLVFTTDNTTCPGDVWLTCDVFIDGSADQHVIGDLERAGWGVTRVDEEGFVTAGAYGPVPAFLSQTSQAAEYVALVVDTTPLGTRRRSSLTAPTLLKVGRRAISPPRTSRRPSVGLSKKRVQRWGRPR